MTTNRALIVVDMQNDFMPGGPLGVTGGDEIVETINRLAQTFSNVVLTQDWHTPGHTSFASSHAGSAGWDCSWLPINASAFSSAGGRLVNEAAGPSDTRKGA